MVLRATPSSAAANPFEEFDDIDTFEAAATQAPAPIEASVAIATAQASSIAPAPAPSSVFAEQVRSMFGAVDFGYGNFPTFKADAEITCTSKNHYGKSLGQWVKGTMIGLGNNWQVGPNDVENQEAKDFLAFSADGVTVTSCPGVKVRGWEGRPVAALVQHLKDEGFRKAAARRFLNVAFAIEECHKKNTGFEGQIVQMILSASSIPEFERYQNDLTTRARAVALGVKFIQVPADPFSFYLVREGRVNTESKLKWNAFRISTARPEA